MMPFFTLKQLFDIVRSIDAWLSISPSNVAVIHCHNGKSRTGVVVACYLRYVGEFKDAAEVRAHFSSSQLKGL